MRTGSASEISVTRPYDETLKLTPGQIVRTARLYVGYPYRSQGRDRHGLDCGGLQIVVARDLGYTDLEVLGYPDAPDGETFERLLRMTCVEVPQRETQVGDIVACDYGEGIQHTAFVSRVAEDSCRKMARRLVVIHAKAVHGVHEHRLSGRDERAWVKTFRLRGVRA